MGSLVYYEVHGRNQNGRRFCLSQNHRLFRRSSLLDLQRFVQDLFSEYGMKPLPLAPSMCYSPAWLSYLPLVIICTSPTIAASAP